MDIKGGYKFWFTNFLIKKMVGSGVNMEAMRNEKLTEELHKPIFRKLKKRTVHSEFKGNIWGADLADMQLISKFSKGFRFLLCVIDIFKKICLGCSFER